MTEKIAFVLMPFAEEFTQIYSHLINDSLEKSGFKVMRADDIKSQNNILRDIVEGIVKSELIVADLTGANPNVYYELGIAHALNKNVILLIQEIDELPFDLRSYRVVQYGTDFIKMDQAKKELNGLAIEAFKGELPFGNPIKDFTGSAKSMAQVITNEMSSFSEDTIEDEELGLLDYRIMFESGMDEMSSIVSEVGEKMSSDLTPNIIKCAEKLNDNETNSKQKRDVLQLFAKHQDDYVAFLRPKNLEYKKVLKDVETGLENIITDGFNTENNDSKKSLEELLDSLVGTEEAASEGRQSFASLITTIESMPNIERKFNRSQQILKTELETFVGNTDQFLAVIARARRIGERLIDNMVK